MKFPKKFLERIILEELKLHIDEIRLPVREKSGEHPDIEDATAGEDGEETKPASDKQPDNVAGKPVGKKQAAPAGEVPGDDAEKPAPSDDEADTDLEKQATGEKGADEDGDEDDEADAEDTEKVSDQLVGKTIQSITANPKSKLMPGAMEIVIQFDQIPDPLKILVTKSGAVKYYYKGLHNEI